MGQIFHGRRLLRARSGHQRFSSKQALRTASLQALLRMAHQAASCRDGIRSKGQLSVEVGTVRAKGTKAGSALARPRLGGSRRLKLEAEQELERRPGGPKYLTTR